MAPGAGICIGCSTCTRNWRVALGEMPGGVAARLFLPRRPGGLTGRRTKVVVLDEDMAARVRREGVEPEILPPWVLRPMLEARAVQLRTPRSAPRTWLYSGNLGRAHEWETLLEAQQLLEAAGHRVDAGVPGGGPGAGPRRRKRARSLGLRRCEWRPYVPEGELPASLLAAEVLVVTQRPETCGLLWPSKLALASLAAPAPSSGWGRWSAPSPRELTPGCPMPASSPPASRGRSPPGWQSGPEPGASFTPEDPALVTGSGACKNGCGWWQAGARSESGLVHAAVVMALIRAD